MMGVWRWSPQRSQRAEPLVWDRGGAKPLPESWILLHWLTDATDTSAWVMHPPQPYFHGSTHESRGKFSLSVSCCVSQL